MYLVIPCGADKLDVPAPARDLYCGSMFRMGLAAAEAEAADYPGEATILILRREAAKRAYWTVRGHLQSHHGRRWEPITNLVDDLLAIHDDLHAGRSS